MAARKTLLGDRESVLPIRDAGLGGDGARTLVDFMTVYGKGDIGVTFLDDTEIRMG